MPPKQGMAAKRIVKELGEISKELPEGVRAGLKNEDNLFEWFAQIDGPADSPYEGGVFDMDISIPTDYPFKPPRAQFKTRVYHMNINAQGGICLDILKTTWSPALSIMKVVLSVLSLLTDPNPNDPLVGEIARQFMQDRKTHDERARLETREFAKPEMANPPVKKLVVAPKSVSMLASSSNTSNTSVDKGKAKARAIPRDTSKPIVIDDDDDDDNAPKPVAGASRKRTSSSEGQRNNKQAKVDPKAVIELD